MHGPPDDYVPRSDEERTFVTALQALVPEVDIWPHSDARGSWVLVSLDIVENDRICAVPRLDFDGESITGGYSPASINWDFDLRAADAGIGPQSRGWITLVGSPEDLAAAAATWFVDRVRLWAVELGRQPSGRSV